MDLRTIELKIARGENLPVLPQAANVALRVAGDSATSSREIERVIEQDPALTAKVLRVVNSPIYAVSQISSVSRAIAVLGINRVRTLVLSLAFQNIAMERQESTRFNMTEYWRHSLAVASAAKIIAMMKCPFYAEELYCTGMLHDIGLIIMAKFCPEKLDSVIRFAEVDRIPLSKAEPQVVPFTHAQLGGVLAKKWGLGDNLTEAIAGHHDGLSLKKESHAAILMVADTLAHEAGFTNQLPHVPYELTAEMADLVGMPLEQTAVIRDVMLAEVEKIERALEIGNKGRRAQAQVA